MKTIVAIENVGVETEELIVKQEDVATRKCAEKIETEELHAYHQVFKLHVVMDKE